MCFTLYLGASIKLPLIEWNKDQPAVHTANLQDDELEVLSRFTFPHILYVGSNEGCGCGFRHALAEGKNWLPVVNDDKDAQKAIQKNHIDLRQYLTDNTAGRSVEIYGCWNGHVADCTNCVIDIRIEDLTREDFYFKEGSLYKVAI